MIAASITQEMYEKRIPYIGIVIDEDVEDYEYALPFLSKLTKQAMADYQTYIAVDAYIKPNSDISLYLMRRLQQFTLGHFQSSLQAGDEFQFELDDSQHKVYGDKKEPGSDPMVWSQALLSSWITRNSTAQDYLAGCDLDQVIEANRAFDTVVSDFSRLYRALHLQQDVRDDLLMAINSPSTLEGGNVWEEVVRDLYIPQLDVIAAIAFSEGEQRFNQAIENALLKHQHHYNAYPDSAVPKTAISVPLMGLSALAHDRLGYRVTVENRYIPQWLVEHQDWSQLPPLADDSLRLNFPVRTRNPLEK